MQALMAETGSLVKCLGLGKKSAGIIGLSIFQDPRDQLVPRRLHSQVVGRKALMMLRYYEQQSTYCLWKLDIKKRKDGYSFEKVT